MTVASLTIRSARAADLDRITEIDGRITGRAKPDYWRRVLDEYGRNTSGRVALVALGADGAVVGHLFGEVRAWEFGSDPCGWIFAVAVHPDVARQGCAAELCRHAMAAFRSMDVNVVRTMVRRNDVPVLSFFRSMGFVGGPFAEMEKVIELDDMPQGGA